MNFGIAIFQSERMNLVFLATTDDPFVASLWFDRLNHGNSTLLKLTSQRRVIGKSAWKCVDLFPQCLDLINPSIFWGSNYQNWLSALPSSFHAAKWKQFTLSKNAIYETVKYSYVSKPFISSSPWNLVVAHSDWGIEFSRNPKCTSL